MRDYHVIVVDDEALSLTNAKGFLNEEGMKVSCLRSGKDLLKYVEKHTADLILLDIMMPEMDGFETFSALREYEKEHELTSIPVIFLTGENDAEIENKGLRLGASDFIRKPFNKDILIRRIHNTIINSKTIESLAEEAIVDKLTGFLNKAGGTAKITKACNDYTGAMIIMDLDSFKLVNDIFGHDMGDRVLIAFAEVVRKNTRESDIISRIGGDEFLAFFMNMIEENAVSSLADRINNQLDIEAKKLMGDDYGIPLGVSLGAVMVPEYGRDYESLFSLADSALYNVKQNGKHGYAIYNQAEGAAGEDDDDLEKELSKLRMIVEERSDMSGALLLGREAFSIVYRFIMRFYKRYGGCCAEVLFGLKTDAANGESEFRDASAAFGVILQNSLRRSDIIMQNRSNQFFVFLNERSKFEAETVIARIKDVWSESDFGDKVSIDYAFKCYQDIK